MIKRKSSGENMFVTLGITTFLVSVMGIVGYIANIIQIIIYAVKGGGLTLIIVLKIIGVFAFPFGAIMGLVGFVW
jgi:hypothetical protein